MTEEHSSRAIASLVCGILSFHGCPVVGAVLAIALGSGERSGLARAGVLLGWIHLALVGLALVLGALVLVALAASGQL